MALSFASKFLHLYKLLEFVLCETKSLNLHLEKRRVSHSAKIAKKEYVSEKGKGKELGSVELVCLVSLHLISAIGAIIIE